MPLLIGVVGLVRVMDSPHFGVYRTVDVVQLLGSGVCFGAAIVGVAMMIKARRIK